MMHVLGFFASQRALKRASLVRARSAPRLGHLQPMLIHAVASKVLPKASGAAKGSVDIFVGDLAGKS